MRTPHTHPDVEVNFLRKGRLRYLLHGRFMDIQPGEIAIFWAGVPHQTLEKNVSLEGVWITVPLPWLLCGKHTQKIAAHLLLGNVICCQASRADEDAFERWRQDFTNPDMQLRDIAKAEIENYLSRISLSLRESSRGKRRRPPVTANRIDGVLSHLAAHYRESITVEDIARAVGLHPKYLLVLFHRACRVTLWEYVLKLRLAHAQRLLLTTDRTVTDIAFDAGFNSLSAFYHAFNKHVPACTPAAFRSSHLRRDERM